MIQLVLYETDIETFFSGLKIIKYYMTNLLLMPPCNYKYRLVKSQTELREKAMIFNNGLDDRIVELIKVLYRNILLNDKPEIELNDILFEAGSPYKLFILSDNSVYSSELDMECYNAIEAQFKDKIDEKSKNQLFIDQEWALTIIEEEEE